MPFVAKLGETGGHSPFTGRKVTPPPTFSSSSAMVSSSWFWGLQLPGASYLGGSGFFKPSSTLSIFQPRGGHTGVRSGWKMLLVAACMAREGFGGAEGLEDAPFFGNPLKSRWFPGRRFGGTLWAGAVIGRGWKVFRNPPKILLGCQRGSHRTPHPSTSGGEGGAGWGQQRGWKGPRYSRENRRPPAAGLRSDGEGRPRFGEGCVWGGWGTAPVCGKGG